MIPISVKAGIVIAYRVTDLAKTLVNDKKQMDEIQKGPLSAEEKNRTISRLFTDAIYHSLIISLVTYCFWVILPTITYILSLFWLLDEIIPLVTDCFCSWESENGPEAPEEQKMQTEGFS